MMATIRMGVLGLVGCALWSCGGTVTRGDSDDSPDGSGGSDGWGDFGSGGSDTDGTGPTTNGSRASTGSESTSAATTRGGGSRNNNSSGTTTTTRGSSVSGSASTDGGVSSSGVGGNSATTGGTGTTMGGFGGQTTTIGSTFGSGSVVTGTVGSTSSVGSTSTTGTAPGRPDELEDYPYLDDCDSSYWSFTSQNCSLNFFCPSHAGWTSCWNVGGGEFSCDCSRDYFWATYRMSNVDMSEACAYAASACVGGPDAEQAPPSCTPSYLYQSTNYCNASSNCRIKVDVDGADVVRSGSNYVHCEQRGDAWTCDCDLADGRLSVRLETSSGSNDMCLDALDWCSGELTREGERKCTPSSQYGGTHACYVNLRCTQDAEAGGVPATLTESYTLSCNSEDRSQWRCDCPGVGRFDVEADTGWDACTIGASECTPG